MRLTARQWQKPAAKRRLLTACRFTLRVSGAHPSKMYSLRFDDDFRERYETRYETAWRYCDYEGLGIWFTSFSYSSNHSVSPRAPTDGRIVIPQETASGDKGDPEQCQINPPRIVTEVIICYSSPLRCFLRRWAKTDPKGVNLKSLLKTRRPAESRNDRRLFVFILRRLGVSFSRRCQTNAELKTQSKS